MGSFAVPTAECRRRWGRRSGGIDEIDGVDAVAAAALGEVDDLLKMVRPRKLSSLPILSALSPSSVTEKLASGVGVTGVWKLSGAVAV